MRQARRRAERDDAILAVAPFYAEYRTGRAIAADCRRLPPPRDPRREAIKRILAANKGREPGVTTVRTALAGMARDLARNQ